ncbi:MAG: hypothetical protein R2911_12650 [Caldilineaceae bacterium]
MRKFSSYGPIDTDLHYYAARGTDRTDQPAALGDDPAKGAIILQSGRRGERTGVDAATGGAARHSRTNLTADEVTAMFRWYEEESGQQVAPEVVDRLFYEAQGQPGLVSWFGELLTETYNRHESSITAHDFEVVFSAGLNLLPNNNILNIISKAREEPYVGTVLPAL